MLVGGRRLSWEGPESPERGFRFRWSKGPGNLSSVLSQGCWSHSSSFPQYFSDICMRGGHLRISSNWGQTMTPHVGMTHLTFNPLGRVLEPLVGRSGISKSVAFDLVFESDLSKVISQGCLSHQFSMCSKSFPTSVQGGPPNYIGK